MELWVVEKEMMIANQVTIADTFLTRLKGWMGKQHISDYEALILTPCSSIHTFGMRQMIDVLYVSADNTILYTIVCLRKCRVGPSIPGTMKVIELKCGTIKRGNLAVGDRVTFIE